MLSGLLTYASCIGSMCVTHNHWSNHITSMAYVKDIFVPYCKATIEKLRAVNLTSSLPFGEQAALLIHIVSSCTCLAIYPPLPCASSLAHAPLSTPPRHVSSWLTCGGAGSTAASVTGSTRTTAGSS